MRPPLALFLAIVALAVLPGRGTAQGAALRSVDYSDGTLSGASTLRLSGSLPARISWTRSEIALATGFTATLLMDASQTRGLARGGWNGFRELNPLLGSKPSVGRINAYTAVAGLAVLGVAAAVPARARPWVLAAAFLVESFTVSRNARAGIPITLP